MFHLSIELSTSSTGDDFQWDLDFQSLDDHPVIVDTGFRLGEDEEEDKDTPCITLYTRGVTAFKKSNHLHSSETSAPTVIFIKHKHKSFYQSHATHLPGHVPLLVGCSVQNGSDRSQHARSWCVKCTTRGRERRPQLPDS